MLEGMVESLAAADVDHLVAVDGRYALYPPDRFHPYREQNAVILRAADNAGVSAQIVGRAVWKGGEVEKRNHMIRVAQLRQGASPRDWFLIIDADERIVHADPDLKARLEAAPEDTAYYQLDTDVVRGLYRNTPGLNVRTAHYGYHDGKRFLWDGFGEPALNLTGALKLTHLRDQRSPERKAAQQAYYQARQDQRIEPMLT